MQFDGAVVTRPELKFAIVIVNNSAVSNNSTIMQAQQAFQPYFTDMPIVLCNQDSKGIPTYYGRPDIVEFLATLYMQQIPWRTYTDQ